jgi:two-component system response regulator DevR
MIKVLLIEDDPGWQLGIQTIIKKQLDMELLGSISSIEDASLEITKSVDVIIMDLMFGQERSAGLDLIFEWSQVKEINARIIVLSSLNDHEVIIEAISSGAVNFLPKSSYNELPSIIRAAFLRNSPIHSYAAKVLRKELQQTKEQRRQNILTPKEASILSLIHEGYPQSYVADELRIVERTLKNHINRILRKLDVRTSKEAAAWAANKGLIKVKIEQKRFPNG